MSIIRARQPTVTRLFPHQGNRRYIVPNRAYVGASPGINPPTGGDLVDDLAGFLVGCNASQFAGWLCQGTSTIDLGAADFEHAQLSADGNAHLHDVTAIPAGDKTVLINCSSIDPAIVGEAWDFDYYLMAASPPPAAQAGVGNFMAYGAAGTATTAALRTKGTINTLGLVTFGYFNTFDGDRRAEFAATYNAQDLTP